MNWLKSNENGIGPAGRQGTKREERLLIFLTGDQGSGILNSLVQADGLAVISEEVDHLPAGAEVEVLLLSRI
jgi:molybdopterin biosynthesis enzyme